jgi:hypothetical protein
MNREQDVARFPVLFPVPCSPSRASGSPCIGSPANIQPPPTSAHRTAVVVAPFPLLALRLDKPVPGEKKTQFPRSTGVRAPDAVRGSRARCSLIENSDRAPVLIYLLERAYTDRVEDLHPLPSALPSTRARLPAHATTAPPDYVLLLFVSRLRTTAATADCRYLRRGGIETPSISGRPKTKLLKTNRYPHDDSVRLSEVLLFGSPMRTHPRRALWSHRASEPYVLSMSVFRFTWTRSMLRAMSHERRAVATPSTTGRP